MTSLHARAIRRVLLVGSGSLVTLVAHEAAMEHAAVTPSSSVVVLGLCAMAAMSAAFHRSRAFRPHRPAMLVVMLLAIQALAHLGMGYAPWVFGLDGHGGETVLGATAIAPHVIAAVVLALICLGAERALGLVVGLIGALRSLTAGSASSVPCSTWPVAGTPVGGRAAPPLAGLAAPRGPPALVSA